MVYGYKFGGSFSPEDGLYFDSSKILIDPLQRGEYGALGPKEDCWPQMACLVPSTNDEAKVQLHSLADYLDFSEKGTFHKSPANSTKFHNFIFVLILQNSTTVSGMYGFCDTNLLSLLTPTTNEEVRSDYLARVFGCNEGINVNQLFFAPYNDNSFRRTPVHIQLKILMRLGTCGLSMFSSLNKMMLMKEMKMVWTLPNEFSLSIIFGKITTCVKKFCIVFLEVILDGMENV